MTDAKLIAEFAAAVAELRDRGYKVEARVLRRTVGPRRHGRYTVTVFGYVWPGPPNVAA